MALRRCDIHIFNDVQIFLKKNRRQKLAIRLRVTKNIVPFCGSESAANLLSQVKGGLWRLCQYPA